MKGSGKPQPFMPAMEARARVPALREQLAGGQGLSAVVVGLGRSGLAAAELLIAQGATVRLCDDRPEAAAAKLQLAEARLARLPVEPFTAEALAAADLVVLSPGVPRTRPELAEAIQRGKLVGEIELASWFVRAPMIGITGTNGKSTTTALTAHLLRAAGLTAFAGGNLGEPLSRLALSGEAVDAAVVEVSSFQLESLVEASFRVACWLNLTPDHLDRYPDVDTYAAAKQRLIERRAISGVAVLNAADPYCADAGIRLDDGWTRWFSASASDLARRQGVLLVDEVTGVRTAGGEEERYRLDGPALLGRHNKANALAAIECARALGAAPEGIQRGLDSFRGLPHRLEPIRTLDGVRWLNDSKATNVDSAVIALEALNAPVILIAGGKDKGAPWAPLVERARGKVKAVLAIGAATPLVLQAFGGAVPQVEAVGTLEAAVERARALAAAGDEVLLSPACASYDQFRDYEDRGETFRRLVERLGRGP